MISLIGHSNWKLEDYIAHLKASGVTVLIDTRSKPYSRFCPWFNQRTLEGAIREAGLQYRWVGERLGGFSNGTGMADALDRLSEWAHVNPNEQLALTCSERDPRECHRFYWLGHYLAHTTDHVIRSLTVGKEDWLPQLSDYPSFEKTQAPWLAAAVAAKVNRAA